MDFSHAPLSRTFTTTPLSIQTPPFNSSGPSPTSQAQNHTSSGSSISSYAYRSSDSTQATAHSVLFAPPTPAATPLSGGPVEKTDNVINKVADKENSLFQMCVNLKRRLECLPEFQEQLEEEEEVADDDTDPVTLLWRTFRRGYPLMTLYNALEPDQPLSIDPSRVTEKKRAQAATFKFLQACVNQLKFPPEECFIITDLFSEDTTGFVKVVKVVNRVLDVLVQEGVLVASPANDEPSSTGPATKRTQRQHIVAELVSSERTYVQHLEILQSFKQLVEEKGVVSGDVIHDIFLNLNALLDFQRRFLIRVEQINAQPEAEQDWGQLFILYRQAFDVYEPFIANQRKCEETATREFEKLKEAGGPTELRQVVETPTILGSFLLKPFQRLTKYPLLLRELRDKGDLDEERKRRISQGIDAASVVLHRTNAAVDREERLEAVEELKARVEDWKGHKIELFGELLLHGTFVVLKGEGGKESESSTAATFRNFLNTKEQNDKHCDLQFGTTGIQSKGTYLLNESRDVLTDNIGSLLYIYANEMGIARPGVLQYRIYLFETILLCCKDINPLKQKNKMMMTKQLVDRRGKPRLQLKGRIFMQNVTEVISFSKPGSYMCQIFWKGDTAVENFIIRFATEEAMKKWRTEIENQRRTWRDIVRASASTRHTGTSETEFISMQDRSLENPYQDEYGDDDDDMETPPPAYASQRSDFAISRNDSSTSLGSRSATGESGRAGGRSAHPKFRSNFEMPSLSLRTQHLPNATLSPGERFGDSYFSPTESPISSRTSTSSGMFPFPRQPTPYGTWYADEVGNARFTAPAVGRTVANLNQALSRPSMQGNGSSQSTQRLAMSQSRLRSVSSPDVHNPLHRRYLTGNAPPLPDIPVPPFPPHIANRSGNNSPNGAGGRIFPISPPRHLQPKQNGQYPSLSRSATPILPADPRENQPTPTPSTVDDIPAPTQLKLKVKVPSEGSSMTLVVGTNISYQSLKDRIDAKLQRHTNLALGAGTVKLKYMDDEDFVSIQSDEDVQTAFELWRESQKEQLRAGEMGEIKLYCQR